MKTRICSIFVVLSVLLGMFLTVTAEDGGNFEPSEYGEAVAFLRDLGLLEGSEDGSVNASKTISRAEFAVLALRVMGMADSAQAATYKPVFTDVPQDYWAAKQILFAVDAGLFLGTSQSSFEPEEPVYMNQAIKVAVCMAGFGRRPCGKRQGRPARRGVYPVVQYPPDGYGDYRRRRRRREVQYLQRPQYHDRIPQDL